MMKPVTLWCVDPAYGRLDRSYVPPKGTVPPVSNHLLTKRIALKTCKGSAIVNAPEGQLILHLRVTLLRCLLSNV